MPRLEHIAYFRPQSLLTLAAVVVVGIAAAVIMQKLTQRKGIRNMLLLSRKIGQSILAGEIEIKVISIQGNRVKLGIEASEDVKILRSELSTPEQRGDAA